ncbi:hypothetical protein C0991_007159 [Blastosporella zonata]|nr:hypothetical protein C0991_007159 [Blastosporella zonata]
MTPLTPIASPEESIAPFHVKPLDTLSTGDFISSLKAATDSLGDIFGKLEYQTADVATRGPAPEIKSDYFGFAPLVTDASDYYQVILKDCLEMQLFEHLKERAQREIEAEIDELVREQVALCLESMIPQNLQDEVAVQNVELEGLRSELLNSENRRANALLRSNQPDERLHEIYMSNRQVSERYPKTLQELFDLDGE